MNFLLGMFIGVVLSVAVMAIAGRRSRLQREARARQAERRAADAERLA